MGRVTGDKSRFNKQRKQKIAKREDMRALRKSWGEKAAAAPKAAAATPKKATKPKKAAPATASA